MPAFLVDPIHLGNHPVELCLLNIHDMASLAQTPRLFVLKTDVFRRLIPEGFNVCKCTDDVLDPLVHVVMELDCLNNFTDMARNFIRVPGGIFQGFQGDAHQVLDILDRLSNRLFAVFCQGIQVIHPFRISQRKS